MKVKFTLIFLIILTRLIVYGQPTSFFIKGTLEESGTTQRIPFASISITNTNIGTATNEFGEFIIKVDDKLLHQRLKISCIGYITKTLSIDSIKNKSQLLIQMTGDVRLLGEVVIKEAPLDPVEIIKMAIESTHQNYLNEPFNMEFYSKMDVTEILTSKKFNLETILFGYSPGYSTFKRMRFEITQKRSTGDDPLSAQEYPYWPSLEIHHIDLISNPYKMGILDSKNLDKFDLKYSGVSLFDKDTVYHIEYNLPRPTKAITGYGIVPRTYKGNIFITTKSNAIVKHELFTDQFSFVIIYKKEEGKYFPYFISGDRTTKGTRLICTIHNTLTLQNFVTRDVKVIDYKTNELENASLLKFDERFWNDFYPAPNK